jgi:hypothetical protein
MQQILDNSGGARLGGVGLDIGKARTPKVAKDEMQIRIKGRNKRCLGHDVHTPHRMEAV